MGEPKPRGYVTNFKERRGRVSSTVPHYKSMQTMNPFDYVEGHDAGYTGPDSIKSEMEKNQKQKRMISAKLQSQGKTTLLTNQTTRKGGGKSGGGGGKFGWIKRMIHRPASPFSLLKTDKNF